MGSEMCIRDRIYAVGLAVRPSEINRLQILAIPAFWLLQEKCQLHNQYQAIVLEASVSRCFSVLRSGHSESGCGDQQSERALLEKSIGDIHLRDHTVRPASVYRVLPVPHQSVASLRK